MALLMSTVKKIAIKPGVSGVSGIMQYMSAMPAPAPAQAPAPAAPESI